MRIGPYTKIPWLGRFSVNNNLNFILFLTWSYCIVGVREKIDSPMHRDSLFQWFWIFQNRFGACFVIFAYCTCVLETRRASLHRICAVRHMHIAWQCVLPPAVFYFRYAFSTITVDAWNSRTDRLSRALCVCLSWSSTVAAVKCTCIFKYFYTKLMYVMFSVQDKTSVISK